jgi:vacuolar-type H+-ATPase subunit I/STV1
VAIIGLTPCVALLPIVFAGTTQGINAVIAIMVVFFVATLGTILTVVGLATKGLQLIRLKFIEKHGEVFTGLVIALMGIIVVGMAL